MPNVLFLAADDPTFTFFGFTDQTRYNQAMTARDELQQELQQRIATYDEAMLTRLLKQMDMLEGQNRVVTQKLASMVDDVREHNKDKDPDELQRRIDEAVDAVRYR